MTPPVPLYTKFYLFECVNADEVKTGAKPKLEERGPYVYREDRLKIIRDDTDEDKDEDIIR